MTSREIQLVDTFVVHTKRERYADFLNSPKRRPEFLRELYHLRDFAPAYVVELSGLTDTADGLITDLRRRGATAECYVMSANSEFDGVTGAVVGRDSRCIRPRRKDIGLLRSGESGLLRR
jgi:hypothetical protein